MTFKLYGMAMSTCTARVLGTLYEIGIDFELVTVDVIAGEHKQPSYLAKNPFGLVPALEDNDYTFFESRAITRYIATKHYGRGTDLLRLGNTKESALVGVWVEVESQNFNPPISAIIFQLVFTPMYGGTTNEQVVEENVVKLGTVLDIYEERLSKSNYLAGDFFTLADLHHFPYTYYLMKTPKAHLINSRPHVKAWWDSVTSRPAIKRATEGMTLI
ncbi:glutathione S-transferase F13-like [Magnolia sinica]|uniref:glutathione S-transferase F13-like n=1 Tax=Magnolia sinica TaxID=86752 RepID=UPI00265B5BAB|nr:glutathione S-transferase F13-like [Magnolia sinica]